MSSLEGRDTGPLYTDRAVEGVGKFLRENGDQRVDWVRRPLDRTMVTPRLFLRT